MTSDKRGAYPDTQETLRIYVDNIIYKIYPHSLKLIVRDFVTFFGSYIMQKMLKLQTAVI